MKHVLSILSPRYRFIPVLVSIILIILSVVACAPSGPNASPIAAGATNSPANSAGPTATTQGYSVLVFLNDKQTATLSVADLSKLPQITIKVSGEEEHGPTLLAALNSIGIKDFASVTIFGFTKGRLATAELTLQKNEVTDAVIMALVSRGTVKLTGTTIGAAKAVIDVNKLVVK